MDTLVIIIGINNTSIIKQVPNHEQKQNLLSLPIIISSHNVQQTDAQTELTQQRD